VVFSGRLGFGFVSTSGLDNTLVALDIAFISSKYFGRFSKRFGFQNLKKLIIDIDNHLSVQYVYNFAAHNIS
jgi:hypothetical protein